MRQVEVLIVGGGPAGCAAAAALATLGRKVLVVEPGATTRDRPIETLPPQSNCLLRTLGLVEPMTSDGYSRCSSIVSVWGGKQPYANDSLYDPEGDGWYLDRSQFDSLLQRTARQSGAELRLGSRVTSCRHVGHNEWRIVVTANGAPAEYAACWLIDAAGRGPWPGRPFCRRTFDRLMAIVPVSKAQGAVAPPLSDRRPWVEAARSGWWYSVGSKDGHLVAVFFTDADLLPIDRGDALQSAYLEGLADAPFTRARLGPANAGGPFRAISASSTIAVTSGGDDWIAIGDAAATFDPIASQGTSMALRTGIEAAEAIVSPNARAAVSDYLHRTKTRFRDYLHTRRYFYARQRQWSDSTFWRRRWTAAP